MIRRLLFRNFHLVHRFDQWVGRRFTPAGSLLLGTFIGAAVYGVNTRATLTYQLFLLCAALIAVAMLSALTFRVRFDVSRRLPRYATVGETLHYSLVVRHGSAHTQRGLSVTDQLRATPPRRGEFYAADARESAARNRFDRYVGFPRWAAEMRRRAGAKCEPMALPDLLPGQPGVIDMRLTPVRRGYLRFAPLVIARPDPLGVFNAIARAAGEQSILVLPRRYEVTWSDLLGSSQDRPGGLSQAASLGGSEEFAVLREYRPRDPLRHIHWKAWARLGTPVVKEFHDECFVRQALVLDTFERPRGEARAFEEAVSVAASFALASSDIQGNLDLLFVGARAFHLSAGPGEGDSRQMLEALACVQPCPDRPFSMLADALMARARDISACVCVFLYWDAERRRLVEQLKALGIPALVLVVAGEGAAEAVDAGPMADQPDRFRVLDPARIQAGLHSLLPGAAAAA